MMRCSALLLAHSSGALYQVVQCQALLHGCFLMAILFLFPFQTSLTISSDFSPSYWKSFHSSNLHAGGFSGSLVD